ncbi:hypothetical protein BGZ65_000276, partial [Modicella reniformis]
IEEAAALIQAAEKSNVVRDREQLEQLKTQFALLAFPVKPEILLKHLNHDPGASFQASADRTLDMDVDEGEGSAEGSGDADGVDKLPTSLDLNIVKTEVLTDKILDKIQSDFYNVDIPDDVWPHLFAQPRMESILDALDLDKLKSLFQSMDTKYSPKSLEIVNKADTSRFDQIVVKNILRLYRAKKVDFTMSSKQFKGLTRSQLDAIKKELPEVINNEGFIDLLENRIVPEPFPKQEEVAYQTWLDKMLAFVDELPPKFNRHKLSVYLLSLKHDMKRGIMDKQKFLRYVAIPRKQDKYNQATLKTFDRQLHVDLSSSDLLNQWSTRVPRATTDDDDEIMREYLSHFMREAKSSSEFEAFFEFKGFLGPLLAQVMLLSGAQDTAKWSELLNGRESLAQLTEQTILKFAPDNPSKFLPADPVVFKLRAKNAKRILVRVYEIKTFEYLRQYGDAVMGWDLKLDGLTPNWEHNLTLNKPALEMHDINIELPELANRRGAFIMDVISNGENSCVYFTKGCLDFVERQSCAGHVLNIIDENQEKLSEKCSVWLNGYYYKPNANGDIIIPYRSPSGSSASANIYLIHDEFTTRREFNHRIEHYTVYFACHIDHESFIAGATGKILVKPTVQIGSNTMCPVDLLEQVQLTIESFDANKIPTTTTVPDFKLHDVEWSTYSFQVPENLSILTATLSAKIKVISTGEYQDLKASRHFEFASPQPDQSVSFEQDGLWQTVSIPGEIVTLLQKGSDGYSIHALGKNGEKRSNIPLVFEADHPLWDEALRFYLRTDENGRAQLGPLKDVDKLICTTTMMSWQISGRERHVYPRRIHSIEGEHISLPLGQADYSTVRKIALFSTTGGDNKCVLDDYTTSIRLVDGLLTIKGLNAGYYTLRMADNIECELVVARSGAANNAKGLEDFVLGANPMLELLESTKHPLYICQPVFHANSQKIDIQLYNWTQETRLCVYATKFVPFGKSVFDQLHVLDIEDPWAMNKTELTPTSFKTGRVLGEEYQYILNRRDQSTHWAGNLLTKPSTLLSPWSIADTTMSTQVMLEGQPATNTRQSFRRCNQSSAYQLCAMGAKSRKSKKGGNQSRAPPLLNFLVHPSDVLINLVPDLDTGLVSIPHSAFKEGTFLEIFAMDGRQSVQRSFAVPRLSHDLEFQKRDLRFKSQLDHTKHYIGERTGVDLDPKLQAIASGGSTAGAASVTLASSSSSPSAVRIVNSVSQVFDLMLTLLADENQKQTLHKFGFITDWHRLSSDAKKDKFSKWNCHELNLFLYKKDRDFFDTTVASFLKNKVMKSFIDDYLIGAPLEKYVALNEFKKLTCMEKCLLVQRVPSMKGAVTQWIKDRVHNIGAASNVKLFLTVMNSGALKESAPGGGGAGRTPTSPGYSPTSPGYSPTSPEYSNFARNPLVVGNDESDDDMGFDFVGDIESASPPSAAFALVAGAAARPIQRANVYSVRETRSCLEASLSNRFKPVDLTKEMGETYYYGRQDYTADDEANLFWLDLLHWDDSKTSSFLSQNFIYNAGSFTDAMGTIALLDVVFRPKEASLTRSPDQGLIVSSRSPALVFHSSTKELNETPMTGSVLVTQQYFEQTEKHVYDEVLRTNVRKYLQSGAEFRPLESYGAHVVLMNATPNPLKVHLEVQIPRGSISVYGSLESGQDIQLSSHGTFQYEYGFYFPETGDFPHYPAHVSTYTDIIAYAAPAALTVREPKPDRKETDTGTWSHILKRGSKDEILTKLASSPLSSLPVEQLLPRLYKDKRFLQQVTSVLRSRQEYDDEIWKVALTVHNKELTKEYLMNQPSSYLNVGDWFTSDVYVNKPHSRLEASWDNSLRYIEYFPLINARAHKATRNATILNDRFKTQYNRFLKYLSQKPRHDVDDLLMLIVYLLAQDRIVEAKNKFKNLSELMSAAHQPQREYLQQLQYDYLWAYLNLCVEIRANPSVADLSLDLKGVRKILDKYRDYPVERWSKMFKDMRQYVDEIEQSLAELSPVSEPQLSTSEGSSNSQQQDTAETTDKEGKQSSNGSEVPVTVDFKIGSESVVTVRHRGVTEITVEYYSIDAETMFSASPLTLSDQGESESSSSSSESSKDDSNSSNSYRLVKPNGIDTHTVKRAVTKDGILTIPILPQCLNTNVMISVSTSPPAATRTWKAYYSQTILVQCLEKTGILKVISKTDGRPIRGGYVKVYAEMKGSSGTAGFWKDGYTDLVGRFAYAQVSTSAGSSSSSGGSNDGGLGGVKRFAVFVDGGREGCVVKTMPVPPV